MFNNQITFTSGQAGLNFHKIYANNIFDNMLTYVLKHANAQWKWQSTVSTTCNGAISFPNAKVKLSFVQSWTTYRKAVLLCH